MRMLLRGIAWLTVLGFLAGASQALSFAGSDWTFTYAGFARASTQLGNLNEAIGATTGVTVTQTEANKFSFPVDLQYFSGTGDFDVTGTVANDLNHAKTVGPLTVSGTVVRLLYPDWNMTGDIVGINPGLTDEFGARAYAVLGRPVLVQNVIVQTEFLGSWVNVGTAELELTSWYLARPVPEPGTVVALGLGLAALARRRKARR